MRTELVIDTIVEQLQQSCGDMYSSCRQAGVSVQFVQRWMKDDEHVRDRIEEAQRVGYMQLESAAIGRAVKGIAKGVYYKGERVDEEIVYSDGLLVKLLEAHNIKFAKGDSGNVYNGPVQINNMPRAESYEDWIRMRDFTLQRRIENDKPINDNVIEAEYVEVEASPFRGSPI